MDWKGLDLVLCPSPLGVSLNKECLNNLRPEFAAHLCSLSLKVLLLVYKHFMFPDDNVQYQCAENVRLRSMVLVYLVNYEDLLYFYFDSRYKNPFYGFEDTKA